MLSVVNPLVEERSSRRPGRAGREALVPAQGEARPASQRPGEPEVGQPLGERAEGDLALEPGERRAQAVVDAAGEGEVFRLAVTVEAEPCGLLPSRQAVARRPTTSSPGRRSRSPASRVKRSASSADAWASWFIWVADVTPSRASPTTDPRWAKRSGSSTGTP